MCKGCSKCVAGAANWPLDRPGWGVQDKSADEGRPGEMAERLKAPVSKTGSCASATWVRIPLSPLKNPGMCPGAIGTIS